MTPRELDRLVAEKVFGRTVVTGYRNAPHILLGNRTAYLPHYSTDIAAAWWVAETWQYNWTLTRAMGLCGRVETVGGQRFRLILAAPGMPMEGVEADTAPMAICLAALLAKGVDISSLETAQTIQ